MILPFAETAVASFRSQADTSIPAPPRASVSFCNPPLLVQISAVLSPPLGGSARMTTTFPSWLTSFPYIRQLGRLASGPKSVNVCNPAPDQRAACCPGVPLVYTLPATYCPLALIAFALPVPPGSAVKPALVQRMG